MPGAIICRRRFFSSSWLAPRVRTHALLRRVFLDFGTLLASSYLVSVVSISPYSFIPIYYLVPAAVSAFVGRGRIPPAEVLRSRSPPSCHPPSPFAPPSLSAICAFLLWASCRCTLLGCFPSILYNVYCIPNTTPQYCPPTGISPLPFSSRGGRLYIQDIWRHPVVFPPHTTPLPRSLTPDPESKSLVVLVRIYTRTT
ncbi:uncharacterized protein C8Q71DRAFT_70697 [Rhodofomes roseus]|uniref:Uncharacterized protein n=1 Tax=Rhodofomes roseus TaxID=34475 RepID=A0ABQ8KFM5_9APHY|nr:uncharacterized protein C8Q71DRAFT_70697 [Rhodofomes roseus]KAH9836190.1 hypothetical protein C8Q71DRAFT_70697 [Rhodofomes roseus]